MGERTRLYVDVDNVLAKTDATIRSVIGEHTNGRVNLRYEDIVRFHYPKCVDADGQSITEDEWHHVHEAFSAPDVVSELECIDGCRQALHQVCQTFEIHAVTSRKKSAWGATADWLEAQRIPVHALHFVGHRQKQFVAGGPDTAVDDDYDQAVLYANAGTRCYLIEHPWNRDRPSVGNVEWVSGWDELVEILLG